MIPLSNGLNLLIQLLKFSKSDVLRSISDNVVNIRQHKAPNYIYTQEERKFHFLCHIWHFMCYVELTCSQDHCIFDWTPCVVSLSFLFSDTLCPENINSWRSYYGNIFWLASYVSCACELFSINLIVFAMKSYHEQLYV